MRFQHLCPILLIAISASCTCCPHMYGPGLTPNPYGSCVGANTIAPPLPMGGYAKSHRPTLAERKQARDLERWYRDLNESPSRRSMKGGACPHCQGKSRNIHYRNDNRDYDDDAYSSDGMMWDGMDGYDDANGQFMDGAVYEGGHSSGNCPTCQQHQQTYYDGQPFEVQPMSPVPNASAPAPPLEPTPAPSASESTPAAFLNHLYSPPSNLPSNIRQVSIPPVDQVLYAPPAPR